MLSVNKPTLGSAILGEGAARVVVNASTLGFVIPAEEGNTWIGLFYVEGSMNSLRDP